MCHIHDPRGHISRGVFKASGISASAGFSTSSSPVRHVRDRSFHIGGLLCITPPCHAKDPGGLLACFSKDMAVPGLVEELERVKLHRVLKARGK